MIISHLEIVCQQAGLGPVERVGMTCPACCWTGTNQHSPPGPVLLRRTTHDRKSQKTLPGYFIQICDQLAVKDDLNWKHIKALWDFSLIEELSPPFGFHAWNVEFWFSVVWITSKIVKKKLLTTQVSTPWVDHCPRGCIGTAGAPCGH